MCRINICGQIGVKISSYGDTQFIKINPLNRPRIYNTQHPVVDVILIRLFVESILKTQVFGYFVLMQKPSKWYNAYRK